MIGKRSKAFYFKLELGRYILWQECLLIDGFWWRTERVFIKPVEGLACEAVDHKRKEKDS